MVDPMKPDLDPIEEAAREAFLTTYGVFLSTHKWRRLSTGIREMRRVFVLAFKAGAAFQREREAGEVVWTEEGPARARLDELCNRSDGPTPTGNKTIP